MQNYRLALKLFIIFILIILLFIPQASLMGLVSERASWRSEAYSSIEQSWPGSQTLAGPVLVIPYTLTVNLKETITEKDGTSREVVKAQKIDKRLIMIPKQLDIQSALDSETRSRGIYAVPIYNSNLQVSGSFETQALVDLLNEHKNDQLQLYSPYLSVLVRDQRGIAAPPNLIWNQQNLAFNPGTNLPNATAGMHAKLPEFSTVTAQIFKFNFDLKLRGMSSMNFALLAENSELGLVADWAHPKFTGELLPEERTINDQGFTAHWRASSFSYNVSAALEQCSANQCDALLNRSVGFDLLQPVDVYQQSERSIKYAVLFILLTFVVLIMFELLKQLRIHPIQYFLVGLALTVFYLLLISLSEHIDFGWAYLIAALASTSLLTLYFGAILHSRQLGLLLGSGLLSLYTVLYVILQAEDNALLMGSLLIFAVLAALMLATRHLDWYALTANALPQAKLNRPEPESDTPPSA
ncbi:cell envelope integrity protein CreD [Thiothrix eikelboomii]|uniref:cell envelope integrity protein CreD n=1 Tax=Thiothrix eikelboomii TaxID=92487 RepID=UPI003BB08EB3